MLERTAGSQGRLGIGRLDATIRTSLVDEIFARVLANNKHKLHGDGHGSPRLAALRANGLGADS
jgi:hypothetical protein